MCVHSTPLRGLHFSSDTPAVTSILLSVSSMQCTSSYHYDVVCCEMSLTSSLLPAVSNSCCTASASCCKNTKTTMLFITAVFSCNHAVGIYVIVDSYVLAFGF